MARRWSWREGDDGGRRIVAYVGRRAEGPARGEFRAPLARTLPDYMVPTAYVFLEGLPLTPNGKVDRASLPAPDVGEEAGAT